MRFLAASIVLVLAFAATAPAQCFGDDGFSIPGTCCAPLLGANLPAFPAWFMPGDGACFLDCGIESVYPVLINLSAPFPVFTDVYISFMTLGGSISAPSTFLIMKYARTWMEAGPAGSIHQVWRFLINTEINYTPASPTPCPVPTCAAAGMTVHFVGSIDYSLECTTAGNNWAVAINLTHLCGDMAHGSFSAKPTSTASHPTRLFALVGPAPFNFAATMPLPQTPMLGESMRSTQANLASGIWIAQSEMPVFSGQLTLVNNDCACTNQLTPPLRWERQLLQINYDCIAPPTHSLNSLSWPPIAPTGFNVFPLGTYAVPINQFPGPESVSVCFGVGSATDPCGFNFPIHLLHGVGTRGGFLSFFFNAAIPPTMDMLDVENMYVINFSPLSMSLGYGAFFLSTMIWSTNF
jgi:hypothetical protein